LWSCINKRPINTLRYHCDFFCIGPIGAAFLTNSIDSLPFSWGFLDQIRGTPGVAVAFGYWVILISFTRDDAEYFDFESLERFALSDWAISLNEMHRRVKS
jgi:hypothetical protein